jgi:hypothetical protein
MELNVVRIVFSAPPMTLLSALEMVPSPVERIAQHGLGRNWLSAGPGIKSTANANNAVTLSVCLRNQPIPRLNVRSAPFPTMFLPQRV